MSDGATAALITAIASLVLGLAQLYVSRKERRSQAALSAEEARVKERRAEQIQSDIEEALWAKTQAELDRMMRLRQQDRELIQQQAQKIQKLTTRLSAMETERLELLERINQLEIENRRLRSQMNNR